LQDQAQICLLLYYNLFTRQSTTWTFQKPTSVSCHFVISYAHLTISTAESHKWGYVLTRRWNVCTKSQTSKRITSTVYTYKCSNLS